MSMLIYAANASKRIAVPVQRLDSPIRNVEVAKIDVAGFEKQVLVGFVSSYITQSSIW